MSVVQSQPGFFQRLLAPKSTPELEQLIAQGFAPRKAAKALSLCDNDVHRASVKLTHDAHTPDANAKAWNFVPVPGCEVCERRARSDAAARAEVEHSNHLRHDKVTNQILYVDGCTICDILKESHVDRQEGREAKPFRIV